VTIIANFRYCEEHRDLSPPVSTFRFGFTRISGWNRVVGSCRRSCHHLEFALIPPNWRLASLIGACRYVKGLPWSVSDVSGARSGEDSGFTLADCNDLRSCPLHDRTIACVYLCIRVCVCQETIDLSKFANPLLAGVNANCKCGKCRTAFCDRRRQNIRQRSWHLAVRYGLGADCFGSRNPVASMANSKMNAIGPHVGNDVMTRMSDQLLVHRFIAIASRITSTSGAFRKLLLYRENFMLQGELCHF